MAKKSKNPSAAASAADLAELTQDVGELIKKYNGRLWNISVSKLRIVTGAVAGFCLFLLSR
jgi:hypothetical protein